MIAHRVKVHPSAAGLIGLTPVLPDGAVTPSSPTGQGIFDYGPAPG